MSSDWFKYLFDFIVCELVWMENKQMTKGIISIKLE